MNETLKILELFAGIGACSKAIENLNIPHTIVDAVEIEPRAVCSFNAIHNTNFEPQDITKWDKDIDVDLIMHGSPCFVAGTKILTDIGYKNIEDIVVGDKVLTHTNKFNEVIDFGSDGKKPIYKVETSGTLPIYCTDNHPFYVRHKTKMWNDQLKKFDYSFSEPEKVRLYNLTKNNNYIGVPIIPDKDTKFSNMSDETLWLLGRYVADGYYYDKFRKDRPSNSKYTCISVGNKKIQDFESHIKTYKYNIDKHRRGCVNYRFGVEFTNLIIDIGLKKGAMNKTIPLEILQLPKHKLKIFLDGYMSGDSCNIKHTSIYQATTISRELAESLVLAIQKVYNIGCRIYYTKRPKKCIIEDRVVNQNDTYMIRFDLNPKKSSYLVDNNCIWYPIKKISNTNTIQTIYNMTVNNDHSYTANNCYVGNCQDFSISGKQSGGDEGSGTRSSLMYETIRIVEKLNPKYVVWENVKNLLSDKHIHNFRNYIDRMKQLGYNSYYQVLDSKNYGVPQHRERIFTVSIREDIDKNGYKFPKKQKLNIRLKDILESEVSEKYYLSNENIDSFIRQEQLAVSHRNIRRTQFRNSLIGLVEEDPQCIQIGNLCGELWDRGRESSLRIYKDEGIAPTLMTYNESNTVKILTKNNKTTVPHQSNQVFSTEGVARTLTTSDYIKILVNEENKYSIRRLTPLEYYRLQGFTDEDYRKARKALNEKFFNGEDRSNAALYSQAGNSITVNVLQAIFKNLLLEGE